jgi:SAM-dependent methyltransferase
VSPMSGTAGRPRSHVTSCKRKKPRQASRLAGAFTSRSCLQGQPWSLARSYPAGGVTFASILPATARLAALQWSASSPARASQVWACHDGVARSVAGKGRSGRAIRNPRGRSVRWPTANQSRTDDGPALGCVIPRRPCTVDTGQPQPAIVRVASEGGIVGPVLDAGCGTGENALHIATLGLPVLGVDVAETALATARAKAAERGIEVEFAAADALQLERLERKFETVLDCGLFHTFDGSERPGYVASLASVTEHGGTLYVLCFSDEGLDTGLHPVRQEELRAAFSPVDGWNVAAIEPDWVQTRCHGDAGAPAWLATIKRI